jgi:hypothetical protein
MPTLKLKFEESPLHEYRLEAGASLTIGRRNTNDIVIENLGVSGAHAKIDYVDEKFLLTDLQSKNGTFVNDKLVASCWLKHGDMITIGKHTLTFEYGPGEKRPDFSSLSMEQTMVMDTAKYRAMLEKNYETNHDQTNEIARETVGVLSFLAGGEGEVKLTKKLTKIGKDPRAEVPVSGLMVGKIAATISNRPNGYYLSYVGGLSKPKVNGVAVKESVKLEEFDIIEVGSAKMQFVYQFMYTK